MTQYPFDFDSPPPPPPEPVATAKVKKRIQITSRESWFEILKTLPAREQQICNALARYHLGINNIWPTAYELYSHMQKREEAVFDVNSVRPVLTRLKDKGVVEFGERRTCWITGRNVYTWHFVETIQLQLWPPSAASEQPLGDAPGPKPDQR